MDKRRLDIYAYLDYRKFTADHFQLRKSLNPHFSHRLFAQRAGIKSSGYFSEVLSGRRHLAKAQIPKFAKAMELDEKERRYFALMVSFSRAKSDAARKSVYALMLEAMPLKVQQVKQSQMEYFAVWYHVAVREALAIAEVKGDGAELAGLLNPPVTEAQAKAALRTLERLHLAARDAKGRWRATHVSLTSPENSGPAGLLLREFQREMMARASESLERVEAAERDLTCVTMSVSAQGLARVKALAADFHKRVLETVQADRNEDRVIQLNVQVFPLTHEVGDAPRRS